MDCNMPVMDGLEATSKIKAMFPNIYIVALTAYTTDGFEAKCYEAGMNIYTTKPITK